jgi:hypothetical protein
MDDSGHPEEAPRRLPGIYMRPERREPEPAEETRATKASGSPEEEVAGVWARRLMIPPMRARLSIHIEPPDPHEPGCSSEDDGDPGVPGEPEK